MVGARWPHRTACRHEVRRRPAGQYLQRLSARLGRERLYDWARVSAFRLQPPLWDHWLLIRRSIEKPDEFICYVVFGHANTALSTLARVAGQLDDRDVLRGRQAGSRPR